MSTIRLYSVALSFASQIVPRAQFNSDLTEDRIVNAHGAELSYLTDQWFDASAYLGERGYKYFSTAGRLLLSAMARLAIKYPQHPLLQSKESSGVIVATNFANFDVLAEFGKTIREQGAEALAPMAAPNFSINVPASLLALRYGLKAFNVTLTHALNAALDAIQDGAWHLIQQRAESVLVASVEPTLPISKTLAGQPASDVVPNWYVDQLAQVGTAFLVLQHTAHLKADQPYALVMGVANGHFHSVDPQADSQQQALQVEEAFKKRMRALFQQVHAWVADDAQQRQKEQQKEQKKEQQTTVGLDAASLISAIEVRFCQAPQAGASQALQKAYKAIQELGIKLPDGPEQLGLSTLAPMLLLQSMLGTPGLKLVISANTFGQVACLLILVRIPFLELSCE